MTEPLLDTLSLPRFAEIDAAMVEPAIQAVIADHRETVAELKRSRPTSFSAAWLPYERATTRLESIWSVVSHLQAVADTPEMRAAHSAAQLRLTENAIAVQQDRALYEVLAGVAAQPEFGRLPVADRVAVERAIRDFSLSGVALAPEARTRFGAIAVELAGLSNDFANALLDATDAWTELVLYRGALAGVPDADLAVMANAAREKGRDGWLVTLQQPSVSAILTFAENRDLRARVYRASSTRASDQGPDAGRFDNSARIARILELRHEAAKLLGFADSVEWSLATKMAADGEQVLTFLRGLIRHARPAAERELALLKDFAASELGIDDVQPWDVAFASNRLRQSRYAIDEQEVRAYFPIGRVMQGWQKLLTRLFGITLVERHDVSKYHPDARYFDVVEEDGTVLAGLYLDLHARAGKRGNAWMSRARPRLDDGDLQSVPVAHLVCNFSPDLDGSPALLSHHDILILLHETGHCLHLLFTRVDRPSISGTDGFEWDAIELPSQLMEDFAWDRGVLTAMSGHFQTGASLPADLLDRMVAARHFHAGMAMVRQIEFALFDMLLHLGTMGSDPMKVIAAVREEVAVIHPPEWQRFPHSFGHIFASDYASGYYSYLWAELLAADGFGCFVEAGVVDRATGDRFRAEVLARGSTRSAAESFRAFRGRDPDPAALLVRHGLQ